MESTYLYHPDSKDLRYQSLLSEEKCLHSRKIEAFLQHNAEDDKFSFLKKHISSCESCKKEYVRQSKNRSELMNLIPSVIPTGTTENELESELDDFLASIENSIIREKRTKKREKRLRFKKAGNDFLHNFISLSTLKGLAFAALSVAILKVFSN